MRLPHSLILHVIYSVARTCNLIFIVLDVLKPLGDKRIIEGELEGFGIRLNKKPPAIVVRKKVSVWLGMLMCTSDPDYAVHQERGGVNITHTVPLTKMDQDEIRAVLGEYKLANCDIAIRQVDATIDDLVDVIEGNRVYIPAIYVGGSPPLDSVYF